MRFAELFQVYSKREPPRSKSEKSLTETFRTRTLMRCRDLFDGSDFWHEVHSKLTYLHGRPRLSDVRTDSPMVDTLEFLSDCNDANFLDFIEYIFPTQAHFHSGGRGNLIEDLNVFLKQDKLPYAITDFVWTDGEEGGYATRRLTAYPRVIRKDSEVVYSTAIEPALELLRGAEYVAANKEFLEALDDFRRADYGDCLTKCGSAFESVLKIICARKKWPFSATDTAAPLLKTVVVNAGLEAFFEQPLILVATIRNRLSSSHGADRGATVAPLSW